MVASNKLILTCNYYNIVIKEEADFCTKNVEDAGIIEIAAFIYLYSTELSWSCLKPQLNYQLIVSLSSKKQGITSYKGVHLFLLSLWILKIKTHFNVNVKRNHPIPLDLVTWSSTSEPIEISRLHMLDVVGAVSSRWVVCDSISIRWDKSGYIVVFCLRSCSSVASSKMSVVSIKISVISLKICWTTCRLISNE